MEVTESVLQSVLVELQANAINENGQVFGLQLWQTLVFSKVSDLFYEK